nr:FAD-dependent oxidoreductase [Pseudarcicella sp.]
MKVVVIGAGFSGLAAATALADKGYDVTIVEKNEMAGGRARMFEAEGFKFDMGPSWYWMPDVFEDYFARFNKKPSDYYHLKRLDPSYSVILNQTTTIDLPADVQKIGDLFESMETGSKAKFENFMQQAAYKYKVGIKKFVWKPSTSITEFLSLKLLYDVTRLDVFQSFSTHIRKYF